MKKILWAVVMIFLSLTPAWAAGQWESQGNFYFLTKNTRESFSATGAGANKFLSKYLTYDGVDFLVKGADDWQDYGRLDLQDRHLVSLPIRPGMTLDEVHFLASGNFGNSYEHDPMLHAYGDQYFYATVTVIFAYEDGVYKSLSVPVFWDWFHLPPMEWSKDGARIKSVGNNPARRDCSLYHLWFANPRPTQPVKDLLVMDSWLRDRPFSDIFAVTLRTSDKLEAVPQADMRFKPSVATADRQAADTRSEWTFDKDLDGWVRGSSDNWDVQVSWQVESYGHKGVVDLPACNWAGDKFSWVENKVSLPDGERSGMRFSRHSAVFSEPGQQWSDGLLRVVIKSASAPETVYEKVTSGEWTTETVDLSKYKGQTVIIRLENHGGGQVKLGLLTSPACDGEDALIDDIRLVRGLSP
jgi:hypothetical protein